MKLVNPKATFEQKGLPIAAAIDGDKKSGWAVDPQFGKNHAAVLPERRRLSVSTGSGMLLTFTLEFNGNNGHNIGRPRLSVSTAARPVGLDGDAVPADAQAALASGWKPIPPRSRRKPSEPRCCVGSVSTIRNGGNATIRWRNTHTKAPAGHDGEKAMICSEGVPAIRFHTQGGDFLEQTHFLKPRRSASERRRGDAELPASLDAEFPGRGEALAGRAASWIAHVVPPNFAGELDHRRGRRRWPVAGARDRQPALAAPFRPRHRGDAERLRQPGR